MQIFMLSSQSARPFHISAPLRCILDTNIALWATRTASAPSILLVLMEPHSLIMKKTAFFRKELKCMNTCVFIRIPSDLSLPDGIKDGLLDAACVVVEVHVAQHHDSTEQ